VPTFTRLLGFLRPYRASVITSALLAALAMVATVAIPDLSGRAIDAIRAGAAKNVEALVEELCAKSPEFAALWRDHDIHPHGDGPLVLNRPGAGSIQVEYSNFAVDGRPDLTMWTCPGSVDG